MSLFSAFPFRITSCRSTAFSVFFGYSWSLNAVAIIWMDFHLCACVWSAFCQQCYEKLSQAHYHFTTDNNEIEIYYIGRRASVSIVVFLLFFFVVRMCECATLSRRVSSLFLFRHQKFAWMIVSEWYVRHDVMRRNSYTNFVQSLECKWSIESGKAKTEFVQPIGGVLIENIFACHQQRQRQLQWQKVKRVFIYLPLRSDLIAIIIWKVVLSNPHLRKKWAQKTKITKHLLSVSFFDSSMQNMTHQRRHTVWRGAALSPQGYQWMNEWMISSWHDQWMENIFQFHNDLRIEEKLNFLRKVFFFFLFCFPKSPASWEFRFEIHWNSKTREKQILAD